MIVLLYSNSVLCNLSVQNEEANGINCPQNRVFVSQTCLRFVFTDRKASRLRFPELSVSLYNQVSRALEVNAGEVPMCCARSGLTCVPSGYVAAGLSSVDLLLTKCTSRYNDGSGEEYIVAFQCCPHQVGTSSRLH